MYIPKITKSPPELLLPRELVNGARHYRTPDGTLVPSVTTILSAVDDKTHLKEWETRIGAEQARQIKEEAAAIGSGMHQNLENALKSLPMSGTLIEKMLANLIIRKGFPKLSEVWGIEIPLYSVGLYAGTADLIATNCSGRPMVVDFKNSRRPKKIEYIDSYRAQIGAYALAYNEMYNENIQEGLIMIANRTGDYQDFHFSGSDFSACVDVWLYKLDQYLSMPSV